MRALTPAKDLASIIDPHEWEQDPRGVWRAVDDGGRVWRIDRHAVELTWGSFECSAAHAFDDMLEIAEALVAAEGAFHAS